MSRHSMKVKIEEYLRRKVEDRREKERLAKSLCPYCKKIMNYFSGLETMPAGLYCPECNDAIYDDERNILCQLE